MQHLLIEASGLSDMGAYACGQMDRALNLRSEGLGFDSHRWSCVEVLGKLLIPHCLCPPGGMKNWKIMNGISCRRCTEFSQEEMDLCNYGFMFVYNHVR